MKKVLIILAAIVAIVLLVGLFLPKQLNFEREIEIKASPSHVYHLVSNFKETNKWSPWVALDSNIQQTYEGPESGLGAIVRWSSEVENVGKGSQEIIEAAENQSLRIKLIFGDMEPAYATWKLSATENGVKAVWGFESELGFFGRYFAPIIKNMVAGDFEKGLKTLKEVAEKEGEAPKVEITSEEVTSIDILALSDVSSTKGPEISEAFKKDFGIMHEFMTQNKLEFIAPPLTIADEWNEKENRYKFTVGIPVSNTKAKVSGNLKYMKTYAGKTIKAVHKGSYNNLVATYMALEEYLKTNHLEMAGSPWEVYISDPAHTEEKDLITWVYYPIK